MLPVCHSIYNSLDIYHHNYFVGENMTNEGMNIYMKVGLIIFSACAIAGIVDGVIKLANSLKTATNEEISFSIFIGLIATSFMLLIFGMMKDTENR